MINETNPKKYDLEKRTALFGEAIVRFAQKIPKNPTTISLISQVVRSGTSVGANYLEADDAESKRDFVHKMSISRKESKETKHWLRIIAVAVPDLKDEARVLWREAQELNLIFSAIVRKKK
jgi:four helix bundle protein